MSSPALPPWARKVETEREFPALGEPPEPAEAPLEAAIAVAFYDGEKVAGICVWGMGEKAREVVDAIDDFLSFGVGNSRPSRGWHQMPIGRVYGALLQNDGRGSSGRRVTVERTECRLDDLREFEGC